MARWRRAFDAPDVPWVRHDASFYRCFLAVATERVGEGREVLERAAEAVGFPLAPGFYATLQRMEPGDGADLHTDAPKLGYEALRCVVQLERDRVAEDGGFFEVPGELSVGPTWGGAVLLVVGPSSWHRVTPTRRTRRSVVLHGWHIGNTPEVAERVRAWFRDVRFDRLPPSIDEALAGIEATADEAAVVRAGHVAWVMVGWGVTEPQVLAAMRAVADGRTPEDPSGDLAAWATELLFDGFDADAWAGRRGGWVGAPEGPRRTLDPTGP